VKRRRLQSDVTTRRKKELLCGNKNTLRRWFEIKFFTQAVKKTLDNWKQGCIIIRLHEETWKLTFLMIKENFGEIK